MRILGLAAMLLAIGSPAGAQSLDWEVVDRFRLWDRARSGPHVVSLDQLLDRVADARSPADIEGAVLQFTSSQGDLHQKSHWNPRLEVYDREYIWPLTYRVRVWASGLEGTCRWQATGARVDFDVADCGASVELTLEASPDGSGSVETEVIARSAVGEARIPIRVRDRLIASIGDSFASGEGNPDVPMDLSRLPRAFASAYRDGSKSVSSERWTSYRFVSWQNGDWTNRWLGRAEVVDAAGGASWWDPRCHRSFYSQHLVAALRYAAMRPKEAVTFVTFACSGAETFRGLLAEQAQPPGYGEMPGFGRLNYPQAEVLVANLCPPAIGAASREGPRLSYERRRLTPAGSGTELIEYRRVRSWVCAGNSQPRKIDALLVSIGGNDVGFGPVIQDALLPRDAEDSRIGARVLRLIRRGAVSPPIAESRIGEELPDNYRHLRQRLDQLLADGTPILQSAYPNPLYDEAGQLCGSGDAAALAAFEGVWPDRNVDPARRWRMEIDQTESLDVQNRLVTPLDEAVRQHVNAGAAQGWRLVDGFQSAFLQRGWCATGAGELSIALPNWDSTTGRWVGWAPWRWSPYASRTRLFRTPNDAAMTQQPLNRRRALGVFSGLGNSILELQQETLMSSSSGSFHPTFEAHAIMGWSVGEELLTALPET